MKYDYLIKNGKIFDETKKDFFSGDIGISGDKIKKIVFFSEGETSENAKEKIENSKAVNIIDANGKMICPGFIDLTNHSDTFWTIFQHPFQQSLISQGITTVLGGNCGSSLAPISQGKDIQNIQKWTDISEININWQSTHEFLNELSEHPIGVNFATLTGHGNLRRIVIGDISREANKIEIEQMKSLLKKSLSEGSFGLSFNLASTHEKRSEFNEIVELSKEVYNVNGLIKHHLQDEGKNLLPALVRLINYIRDSSARTQISHFKAIGKTAWEKFGETTAFLEMAINEEKLPITVDFFPYNRTGSNLYLLLPEWVKKNGKENILRLIKDKEERKTTIDYLKTLTLHYDKIIIASTLTDKDVIGKTILEISKKTELSPEELILNLLDVNMLNVTIFNEALNYENINELFKKQYASFATDGAGYDLINEDREISLPYNFPHPRSFGAMIKILSEFVKEKKMLTFGEAIYKMTSCPAKVLGLNKRGFLKEDFFADIVFINPDEVKDKSNYEKPFQFSKGVTEVFVNGKLEIENGDFTFKKNGRVLRKE